uniref:PROP1-like PPR domain-containing protein n=1 Tax=Trypanosoma vivax (strain Y486) TaxID=1055687 RepID=G0TRB9_TRYVY|nr:conserved hypothetical protein, fragment [Trypanosoma vivax Y486]
MFISLPSLLSIHCSYTNVSRPVLLFPRSSLLSRIALMLATKKQLTRALSPYAQALKHVAVRGAVAFGPSAKEMELDMYRRGVLPADYRPPAQGKWDDTIERWAYAWQFPAEEEEDDLVTGVERNTSGMRLLLEFGDRLVRSQPSAVPLSGKNSSLYPPVSSALTTAPVELPPTPQVYKELEHDITELTRECGALECTQEIWTTTGPTTHVKIPLAFIDNGSEVSNASKQLAYVMENLGLEYAEDGLIIIIASLSRQGHRSIGRAIFNFVCAIGLGPSAELYRALMKDASRRGDVNEAMALIEEMKEKGITPRIGNWHELMYTFYRAKDYAAVSQIVDNMKMYANIEPNEVTFALQLKALSRDVSQLNSLPEAIQLFDQMENVYGFIASRPHYDAMMYHLSLSPVPEMRLRCEELAQKMQLMGIVWNANTYLNLIRSAQVVGDVLAVEKYLGKMRDDGLAANILHLSWAIQAHVQHKEAEDGTPKGETFEDKNEALRLMGIASQFPTKEQVPDLNRQKLLPRLRSQEGEVAGSLWAMDGGEFSYPKDGGGPQGWGVRLWRERQLIKGEYKKVLDGLEPVPKLSALGNSVRTAVDQLEIEKSGAKSPGELSDYRNFVDHRFDGGVPKPESEFHPQVPHSAELVWQGEVRDSLSPYKSDEEIALENDNTFFSNLSKEAGEKVSIVVGALQQKRENSLEVKGKGVTRRSKYDYLEKWRDMYRHGTLEAPERPALNFGRTPDDHKNTMAALVRDWYQRNKKSPPKVEMLRVWEEDVKRDRERVTAHNALKKRSRMRRNLKGK